MALSALQVWQAIPQTKEIVDYFRGIFDVIGVTIEETGRTDHRTGGRADSH